MKRIDIISWTMKRTISKWTDFRWRILPWNILQFRLLMSQRPRYYRTKKSSTEIIYNCPFWLFFLLNFLHALKHYVFIAYYIIELYGKWTANIPSKAVPSSVVMIEIATAITITVLRIALLLFDTSVRPILWNKWKVWAHIFRTK